MTWILQIWFMLIFAIPKKKPKPVYFKWVLDKGIPDNISTFSQVESKLVSLQVEKSFTVTTSICAFSAGCYK